MKPARGRRPGSTSTRDAILDAARILFAERGYDGASVRKIAESAGVDPAMINHHFGSKEQLFLDALAVPIDPGVHIYAIMIGPRENLPERLLKRLLSVWDSPVGSAAAAMLRTAIHHEWSARLFREFLTRRALGPIAEAVGLTGADARWRTGLLASQIMGLIMARYILKIEPLASATPEHLIADLAPTVRRYLFEPLTEHE